MSEQDAPSPDPQAARGPTLGPNWYGEQDENGVDLSMIRELLRLTPAERLRRADRARRDALRLLEYGRRHRQRIAH